MNGAEKNVGYFMVFIYFLQAVSVGHAFLSLVWWFQLTLPFIANIFVSPHQQTV